MTAVRPGSTSAIRGRLRRLPWTLVAALVFLGILAVAVFAPQALATHDPFALDYPASLQAPSAAHWFGTDESGRDLYSRVVWGARESVLIGLGAAAVGLAGAILLGSLAALGPRPVRAIVDRFVEILFAFPALLLALLLVAIAGPSALTQIFAVGFGKWVV